MEFTIGMGMNSEYFTKFTTVKKQFLFQLSKKAYMLYQGVLKKMLTENAQPIQYYLNLDQDFIHLNQKINTEISLKFLKYQCLNCGENKKIYRQGFCYSCFGETPRAGEWIMHPEKSKAHLDEEDRDLVFEKEMQLQPHIVYLANSSNVKVGVTRKKQLPTRWIDQGAHEALVLLETPNRYLAGVAEVALKQYIADKTNWRKMLKNDIDDENLEEIRADLVQYLPDEVKEFYQAEAKEMHLQFPVEKYPSKPTSLNLEKNPVYKGKLVGIKGQYLIFEDNRVFNVRNNEGFFVEINA